MRKNRVARALGIALLALASLPAIAVAEGELSIKREYKKEVLGLYKRLQTDVELQAARKRLKGNMLNPPVVDSYLKALPIPPLEMFRLELRTRFIDVSMPDFIETYNERWKELHPQAAERYYGPGEARREKGILTVEELGIRQSRPARKTGVTTNQNLAVNDPYPPLGFQSEVQIVVNPSNPSQVVAASNTRAAEPGPCGPRTVQSIFHSSNGGASWVHTCAPPDTAYGLDCAARGGLLAGSDPAVVWGNNGEIYLNHMMICFSDTIGFAMVVARSLDGGATWSPRGIVKNSWDTGDVEDKEFLAIDNHPGSPWFGRLYSCWNHNNDQVMAFSTDNGATWTERDLPAPPQGGIDINCDMAVQKNGTVHMVLETITCGDFDCEGEWLYHFRSTNGGQTWSSPKLVAQTNFVSYSSNSCPDAQNFRCLGALGALDVDNSGTSCDGTVYVGYSDFPNGTDANSMDILVKRSTNQGNTWSAAERVNDDGPGGRIQFNPFLSVDQVKGQPVLAWVDARLDPNNVAVDVFTARSTNCGAKFKKNVKVTQPSPQFNNSTISSSNESDANPARNGNQLGDYMGVDARNGKAYVAWTDTRHFFPDFQTDPQKENIGFAVVTFGPPAPQSLTAVLANQKLTVSWSYTPPADLASFNVYRVANGVYTLLGNVPASALPPGNTITRTFTDGAALSGKTFAVAAVDKQGEEGPYTNLVAVSIQ
ncbi:MAG TPA: hypothetical protein VKK31_02295 [Thermoanaerobaculia bacterium]|nr:hypothetical protein [Thermoanaerobaculia bacterium]